MVRPYDIVGATHLLDFGYVCGPDRLQPNRAVHKHTVKPFRSHIPDRQLSPRVSTFGDQKATFTSMGGEPFGPTARTEG